MSFNIILQTKSDGMLDKAPSSAIAVLIRRTQTDPTNPYDYANMETLGSAVAIHPRVAITAGHVPHEGTFRNSGVAYCDNPGKGVEIIAGVAHPKLDLKILVFDADLTTTHATRSDLPGDDLVNLQGFGGTDNEPPVKPPMRRALTATISEDTEPYFYIDAKTEDITHPGDSGSPVFVGSSSTECCGLFVSVTSVGNQKLRCVTPTHAVIDWVRTEVKRFGILIK